jgi:hypothetical protein
VIHERAFWSDQLSDRGKISGRVACGPDLDEETPGHAALVTHGGSWRRRQLVTPGEAATINMEPSLLKPAARTSSFSANNERLPTPCLVFRYNPIATPFGWRFTRRDLHDLL